MIMKILIIGCNGQLGYDMVSIYNAERYTVNGIDYPEIDITDRSLTETIIKDITPNIIINCAAYTAVDACEDNSNTAFAVNAEGIANIACSAELIHARVVHISTDYVFDGLKNSPYIESDITNPQSVYGKSKLEGEKRLSSITDKHYIFRIAWLYGTHGSNFVKTIRHLALKKQREGQPLRVVNDQFGTPTYTRDICKQIMRVLPTDQFGLYHCTNEGECTWYDFACHIVNHFNIDIKILPCSTAAFPRPAPRPPYAVLGNYRLKSLGIHSMLHWKDAFNTFIEKTKENEL